MGSIATLSFGATASPDLTPDVEGVYVVTLESSDFLGAGAPDSVEITATTSEGFAETQIVSVDEIVDVLPPENRPQCDRTGFCTETPKKVMP